MNIEKMSAGKIMDRAFAIYREKFWKQYAVTVIINLIYMAVAGFTIWYGFFVVVPNTPKRVMGIIEGNIVPITVCIILLLTALLFQSIAKTANIIIAHYDESLLKSCSKIIKSIPRILSVLIMQIIIYLPFAGIFVYTAFKANFNKTVIYILLAFIILIFLFLSTLLMLSFPISQSDNSYFINPIKKSFSETRHLKHIFRYMGINILWLMAYWGVFIFAAIIAGSIFPVPAALTKIYLALKIDITPLYVIGTAYLLIMFIMPLGKNISYVLCNPEQSEKASISGFGSKLFAAVIDLYILAAVILSVFYIMFLFLSKNTDTALFTVNLSLLVWFVIFLTLAVIMIAYKMFFKFLLKCPTMGEKLMGYNKKTFHD